MKETPWQIIFLSSRANGGQYVEPEWNGSWDWPSKTWFQARLALLRAKEAEEE